MVTNKKKKGSHNEDGGGTNWCGAHIYKDHGSVGQKKKKRK